MLHVYYALCKMFSESHVLGIQNLTESAQLVVDMTLSASERERENTGRV